MTRRVQARVVFAALVGVATACGKKGDPLPPLRPTPAAVTGIRVAQRGDQLEIRFTAPHASTDGARLPVLEVELLVADREGDLPKVAATRRIKVAPGETLVETQPLPAPGTSLRVAARAIAKGNQGRPGELARLTVVPPLSAPGGLVGELTGEGVSLKWEGEVPAPLPTPTPTPALPPDPTSIPTSGPKPDPVSGTPPPEATGPGTVAGAGPSEPPPLPPAGEVPPPPPDEPALPAAGPEAKGPKTPPTPKPTPKPFTPGFFIYRRAAAGRFEAPVAEAAVSERSFVDRSLQPGESVCYEVRAVASGDPLVESAPSNETCLDVKDVRAPDAPTGLTALLRDDGVEIRWSPSSEPDLAAYRVYRVRRGENEQIAEIAVPETVFVDPAPAGRSLRYVVTALDKAGNESPASAPVEVSRSE